MSDFTLAIIAMSILVALFLTVCWIAVSSLKLTELTENHLNQSKFVLNNQTAFSGAGLLGLIIRNGAIALLFLIPKTSQSRGLIEPNELTNVPRNIKIQLIAPWLTGLFLFLALFIIWLLFV